MMASAVLPLDEADDYVQFLRSHATLVQDPPEEHGHCSDPDDDYLITLARAARTKVLVSGDSDLLSVANPDPLILGPRDVVETLEQLDRQTR